MAWSATGNGLGLETGAVEVLPEGKGNILQVRLPRCSCYLRLVESCTIFLLVSTRVARKCWHGTRKPALVDCCLLSNILELDTRKNGLVNFQFTSSSPPVRLQFTSSSPPVHLQFTSSSGPSRNLSHLGPCPSLVHRGGSTSGGLRASQQPEVKDPMTYNRIAKFCWVRAPDTPNTTFASEFTTGNMACF